MACMLERGWTIACLGNSQRLNWRWSRSKRHDGCACNTAISSALIFAISSIRVPVLSSRTVTEVAGAQPAKRVYQSIKLTEQFVGIDGAERAA